MLQQQNYQLQMDKSREMNEKNAEWEEKLDKIKSIHNADFQFWEEKCQSMEHEKQHISNMYTALLNECENVKGSLYESSVQLEQRSMEIQTLNDKFTSAEKQWEHKLEVGTPLAFLCMWRWPMHASHI